ncbi:hypothetical protein D3C85_1688590 [compost metagenome]
MPLGNRVELLQDLGTQDLGVHAGQWTQVKLQRTLAADAVGIVAAMDAAEIHRWHRHAKLWIAEFALP